MQGVDRDGLIGRRIRRRRLFLKRTQAGLARALGVTYQQLQKYENGLNKVPPKRLGDLAHLLEVSPDYFSAAGFSAEKADVLERFIASPQGTELNRAVAGLAEGPRARLVLAAQFYCDGSTAADDPEIAGLTAWLRKMSHQRGAAEIAVEAEANVHAAKAQLAGLLGKALRRRKMTQAQAAQILCTSQARLSRLVRGQVGGVSLDKLLRYLLLLGWDIGIEAAPRPPDKQGKVVVRT